MTEDLRVDEYPFTIRRLPDGEGGGYFIEYPDLPGCMSDGDTPEQAIENGRDAVRAYILDCKHHGDPVPAPGGKLLMSVPSQLHARLDERAKKQRTDPDALAAKLIAAGLDVQDSAAS